LIRIGDSLPLTIGTTSANQAFTLLDNGNIGIGNSSPNGALSFADDVRTRKIVLWDGSANNDYQFYGFGVESSTMIQSVYDSTDRFLWVAGTGTTTRNELMVVQGNGNVGIGTSSPSYKLDVSGQQRITLAGYAGIEYHNTPGTWEVYVGTENNTGNARYNSRIGNHTWYANSSATMALSASGAFRLNSYGSGTFTGTATQKLAVDSSGNVIEIPIGAGPVDGSGTANYITRWVDTDTITTSSIYESSGNIGIGITSPQNKLSIGSTQDAGIDFLYDTTNNYKNQIKNYWNSSTDTRMDFNIGYTSGSSPVTVMSVGYGGNVGIGTTAPVGKLTIKSPGEVGSYGDGFVFQRNASTAKLVRIYESSADGFLEVRDGGDTIVSKLSGYTGTPSFLLSNVGIGTNNPSAKLDVSAGTNLNLGIQQLSLDNFSNDGIGITFSRTSSDDDLMALGVADSDKLGLFSRSGIIFATSGSSTYSATSEVMRITEGGNVGIGTTSPTSKLSIQNAGSSDSILMNFAMTNGSNAATFRTDDNVIFGIHSQNSGDIYIKDTSDNVLFYGKNGGNVGIGTTNPSALLHLSSTSPLLKLTNTSAGAGAGSIQFYSGSTQIWNLGTHTDNDLYLYNNTTATYNVWVDNNNGNVGIGTSSPGYKLDVSGIINAVSTPGSYGTLIRIRDTVSSGTESFAGVHFTSSPGTDYTIGKWTTAAGAGLLQIRDQAGNQFVTINSAGYVGIGTVSPSYLLDVNGTARVTALIETSAAKYKTNIQPLDSQLSKVAQLEPVTFDWIDKPNPKTNIGLIADEVEKIYPEFVSKTEDGEIEGIEYSKLTTVLIQSIKELKEIVDQQQAQINKLLSK
jgi:hypothetical protein